jgi:hypothetical protein
MRYWRKAPALVYIIFKTSYGSILLHILVNSVSVTPKLIQLCYRHTSDVRTAPGVLSQENNKVRAGKLTD